LTPRTYELLKKLFFSHLPDVERLVSLFQHLPSNFRKGLLCEFAQTTSFSPKGPLLERILDSLSLRERNHSSSSTNHRRSQEEEEEEEVISASIDLTKATNIPSPPSSSSRENPILSKFVRLALFRNLDEEEEKELLWTARNSHKKDEQSSISMKERMRQHLLSNILTIPAKYQASSRSDWEFEKGENALYVRKGKHDLPLTKVSLLVEFSILMATTEDELLSKKLTRSRRGQPSNTRHRRKHGTSQEAFNDVVEMSCGWCLIPLSSLLMSSEATDAASHLIHEPIKVGSPLSPSELHVDEVKASQTSFRRLITTMTGNAPLSQLEIKVKSLQQESDVNLRSIEYLPRTFLCSSKDIHIFYSFIRACRQALLMLRESEEQELGVRSYDSATSRFSVESLLQRVNNPQLSFFPLILMDDAFLQAFRVLWEYGMTSLKKQKQKARFSAGRQGLEEQEIRLFQDSCSLLWLSASSQETQKDRAVIKEPYEESIRRGFRILKEAKKQVRNNPSSSLHPLDFHTYQLAHQTHQGALMGRLLAEEMEDLQQEEGGENQAENEDDSQEEEGRVWFTPMDMREMILDHTNLS
jgi:hypothetical protein